ncbi:Partner of Y14 and mago-like protein [Drosera capensis]
MYNAFESETNTLVTPHSLSRLSLPTHDYRFTQQMASSDGSVDATAAAKLAEQLGKTLKEGERILAPTRRPDGTLRKPIRIRAGYVPQEEVEIYQSKGALWRKEMEAQVGPPGFDGDVVDVKPKSKSVKRNERKKEKRFQAALEKTTSSSDTVVNEGNKVEEQHHDNLRSQKSESAELPTTQLCKLSLSADASDPTPVVDSVGGPCTENSEVDIDKKIRALKKKIRLTEALQQKTSAKDMNLEQLDKVGKLESWREELKLLEDKKAAMSAP